MIIIRLIKLWENCAVPITTKEVRLFISPSTDQIFLPEKRAFHSEDDYYATALHEIAQEQDTQADLIETYQEKFGLKVMPLKN